MTQDAKAQGLNFSRKVSSRENLLLYSFDWEGIANQAAQPCRLELYPLDLTERGRKRILFMVIDARKATE